MKEKKLKKLFEAARQERQIEPSATFADRVLSAIRNEPAQELSWLEALVLPARQMLIPALALIMVLGALDLWLVSEPLPDAAQMRSLTDEWIFEVN